ncbi:MAG: PIN domain-containing protein [Chloroflexi bacterium]|nr:PIN domain-containing protein [Chloroflexota bacterium]
MRPTVFIDTSILLRHFLNDDPVRSPKATVFLKRIEEGQVVATLSDTVVFETVFNLERRQGQAKRKIQQDLLPLLELPGVHLPGKRQLREVFDLYVERNIPFADAHHAVVMRRLKISQIASFDKHFDRIPGINRVSL